MIKTFTRNDLIRYIYQETTKEENTEIENALIFDEALCDELGDLQLTVNGLGRIERSPSKGSIDKILSYSKYYNMNAVN